MDYERGGKQKSFYGADEVVKRFAWSSLCLEGSILPDIQG